MNTTAQDNVTLGPTVTVPSETVPGKKPPKKRIRNFTADDRAAHRIFEKGRREAFKERLIELAGQLPALADADPQRLSKHVVIDESIARHKLLESRCVGALRGIQSLIQERDELLAEVNNWRSSTGTSLRQPRPIVINVDGLIETEKDTQRRASAVRVSQSQTTRRSSEQSGGPSEEAFQAAVPTEWDQPDETAHIPRVLPSEPIQDVSAASELNGLLIDSSWPQVTQDRPVTFSVEPAMEALALPGQQSMQSDAHSDLLPASKPGVNNYQLLENINTQQDLYRDIQSMEYTATNMSFETSHVPPSPSYLSSVAIQQSMPFQHQQQWVPWPG
ncbi:uncharacterized protein CTRU02_209208 [Colletotrichum truncatum]|uniref:Uncharacterized protein n=1 Tax=Colletotrichum truncatum TaxID=5467 RepID=A0ACC3YZS0_COLTU|nr:uncharacterized protein CTRU02_15320 [Colletotrichum truncatum]KAF6781166.1 hypothetical protein CTRU02_15320 [Colletotrichum truncatum]